MNEHLETYGLMDGAQRGARAGVSGTIENLLIDRMVTLACHWRKRNLSMDQRQEGYGMLFANKSGWFVKTLSKYASPLVRKSTRASHPVITISSLVSSRLTWPPATIVKPRCTSSALSIYEDIVFDVVKGQLRPQNDPF
ncbi:hypothetical protein P5673_018791 [Acropora cervicornis]|uniref:Uncharacterized protein n=1 Tax=Acropora cervicornis TaxID=6130 RepID=A0AAD9QCZ5_ACRCE|nr:hypothetical protein P5673_018791 [Acropora cervicornis]